MRILELITLGEIGGAQTVLVDLVKGFVDGENDAEIDVVFGEGDYLFDAFRPWFSGKIIQTPYLTRRVNLIKDLKALFWLKKLCEERKYDLVHCHSSKASWIGRVAALWAGVPRVVVTVHGISFRPELSKISRIIYKNIERMLVSLKCEYIFVSPFDMLEMETLGLNKGKCVLIPNGRPVPSQPCENLREQLFIDINSPIVCMVGRLSQVKNPLSFIRIAKHVINQWPRNDSVPSFVLVGDGPMRDKCEKLIHEEDLENNVYLLGHVKNAGKYFWNADLAVLTSAYEACPLVAIEAMATGTPVIASDVGGTGSVIKHGGNGYLYQLNNEYEAAQYIIELLKNNGLREEMGRKAAEIYREYYTVDRMVSEYLEHFRLNT